MSSKVPGDYIVNAFKSVGYSPLLIKRSGGRCVIIYICPNKHRHRVRWGHWRRGDRCSICRKTDIGYIRQRFEKEGYKLLSNKYISYSSKLSYICPNGHRHSISWDAWKNQHQRCPYCSGNAKHNILFIKSEFESEDYELLTKNYINAHQKLRYLCPKGHVGYITRHKWYNGQRCVYCSNINFSIKQIGCGNSNWKGGTSCEPYCDAWADKEYKESIKERDGYKCQNPDCWKTSSKLVVHHIDYNKKNCYPTNLITLCGSCNSRANANRDSWMLLYQSMTNNSGKS